MKQTKKTKSMVLLGLLAALLIVMSFTPIGYLRVGFLSITFNMIPVAIGAIALGPIAGLVLGTIFGITSFVQCFGYDAFGTFLAEQNVFFTFVMCVVARALAGFLVGVLDVVLERLIKKNPIRYAVSGLMASLFNTLFFVGSMLLLFGKNTISDATGGALDATQNVILFFASFVTLNAVWEAVAALLLTGAICTALWKAKMLFSHKKEKEA